MVSPGFQINERYVIAIQISKLPIQRVGFQFPNNNCKLGTGRYSKVYKGGYELGIGVDGFKL